MNIGRCVRVADNTFDNAIYGSIIVLIENQIAPKSCGFRMWQIEIEFRWIKMKWHVRECGKIQNKRLIF